MGPRDAARLRQLAWALVALAVSLLAGVPLVLFALGLRPSPLGWALLASLGILPLAFALRIHRGRGGAVAKV